MVRHLFSQESVNVHCVWIGGKLWCGYVLVDQGLYSTLSSYYFLYLAPLVIKSTGMGIPVLDCGWDGLERVDLFKELRFQTLHEVLDECGLIGYFGSLCQDPKLSYIFIGSSCLFESSKFSSCVSWDVGD